MSSQEVEHVAPVATPGRIGQGTAIEQSRAVAEVQAQVVVAQQMPRDVARSRETMRRSCTMPQLAERAFYSFPRGGKTVTGPTIEIAREIAICWGNMTSGLTELRRDDVYAQSEMQAWAWDLQSNTRVSSTFIVVHTRVTRDHGTTILTDPRDIYEKNTNDGARRLREAIFQVIPVWFKEEAIEIARQALARGDGKPIEERREAAVEMFESLGVTRDRLVQRMGDVDRWTGFDLGQLLIEYRSIERAEVTADDVFPPPRLTPADIPTPVVAPPEYSGKTAGKLESGDYEPEPEPEPAEPEEQTAPEPPSEAETDEHATEESTGAPDPESAPETIGGDGLTPQALAARYREALTSHRMLASALRQMATLGHGADLEVMVTDPTAKADLDNLIAERVKAKAGQAE